MISNLIINPHLVPSNILLILGGSLCVISLIHLFIRSKAIVLPPIPSNKFNKFEKKLLTIGAFAFALGFLSFVIIHSFFGNKYFYTDINGIKEIKQFKGITTSSSLKNLSR